MKRRKFVKTTSAVVAGTCLCGASINACSAFTGVSDTPLLSNDRFVINGNDLKLDMEKTPELDEIGSSVKIEHGVKDDKLKVIVAKTGENSYLAFENKCTHGQREIEYNHNTRLFRCVSFGHSKYNLKGEVTGGPAPNPLKEYSTIFTKNSLIIKV